MSPDTTDTIPATLTREAAEERLLDLLGATHREKARPTVRDVLDRAEALLKSGNPDTDVAAILRAFVAGKAAAPSQPAAQPAQGASLEPDAEDLWTDYRAEREHVQRGDREVFLAGVEAGRRTRAVDASRPAETGTLATARPALSEERAREIARECIKSSGMVADVERVTAALMAASRGDDGAPGESPVIDYPYCPPCHCGYGCSPNNGCRYSGPPDTTDPEEPGTGILRTIDEDEPARGCCGEFETGSGRHDPDCENAGEEDR